MIKTKEQNLNGLFGNVHIRSVLIFDFTSVFRYELVLLKTYIVKRISVISNCFWLKVFVSVHFVEESPVFYLRWSLLKLKILHVFLWLDLLSTFFPNTKYLPPHYVGVYETRLKTILKHKLYVQNDMRCFCLFIKAWNKNRVYSRLQTVKCWCF